MRRGARLWVLAVAFVGCAGEGHGGRGEVPAGKATVGGTVVATVDGMPVDQEEVARVARETGESLQDSLRRIEDERLLAREALRRGYGESAAAKQALRKAAVQALLSREVEAAVPPSSITQDQLHDTFEAHRASFEQPERRASVHVLAKVAEDADPAVDRAARTLAEQALADFRKAGSGHYEAVLDEYRARRKGPGFDIVVEEIPAVDRKAPFAQPYLDALFAAKGTGPVDAPVRTRFGWHAILVTDIQPAEQPDFAKAEPEIRGKLLVQARARRLVELVQGLEQKYRVHRSSQQVLEAAFGGPEGGGGMP